MSLAIPMAMGTAITSIYGIINTYFVGHWGTVDMLAAVNYGNTALTIMMAVGGLFGVGAGTMISRMLGEKRFGMVRRASSFGLWGQYFCQRASWHPGRSLCFTPGVLLRGKRRSPPSNCALLDCLLCRHSVDLLDVHY